MSFLKIKDPSKRDKLVTEYLKTKNKIQEDFRSERLGEQSLYEDFGKIFKPITEQQKKSSEKLFPNLNLFRKRLKIHQRCKHWPGDRWLKHFLNLLFKLI